jgi:hypothetical protein
VEVKATVREKEPLLRATLPEELHFYAVDERAKNPRGYRGLNFRLLPAPDQAVIQVHRWLGYYGNAPVGDWVIAERLFVYRGESLGRDAVVKVPIWIPAKRGFVLANKEGSRVAFRTGINNAPLLVDFEGGPLQPVTYQHVVQGLEGAKLTTRFEEIVPMGMLLLSPSGKLLFRKSDVDERDEERVDRHKKWADRMAEVEKGPVIPFQQRIGDSR